MKALILKSDLFLGDGGERRSYIHPHDTKKIIKVLHTHKKHNNQNKLDYDYSTYLSKKQVNHEHITKCFGWVNTDQGKGLIFERVENFDKTTIKTFSYYIKYNLLNKPTSTQLIKCLQDYLFQNNILFVDASLSNIFCKKTSPDTYKLIIFDGLGARRTGFKFWLYLHSSLFTKYKIKKQWKVFMKNFYYEETLKLTLPHSS